MGRKRAIIRELAVDGHGGLVKQHMPLVRTRNPMLPDGGDETVCAQCGEQWPCTVTVLLAALKAVESSIYMLGLHTDEDDCEGCRLRTQALAAIAKAEGRDGA